MSAETANLLRMELETSDRLRGYWQDTQTKLNAAIRERDEARAELAKVNREKYPFVHLRFDVSGAEVESALRAKLIELGWTPPADLPPPAAAAPEAGPKPQDDPEFAFNVVRQGNVGAGNGFVPVGQQVIPGRLGHTYWCNSFTQTNRYPCNCGASQRPVEQQQAAPEAGPKPTEAQTVCAYPHCTCPDGTRPLCPRARQQQSPAQPEGGK